MDKLWALHCQKSSLACRLCGSAGGGLSRHCRRWCCQRTRRPQRPRQPLQQRSAVFQRQPASAWQPVVLPAASTASASHQRCFSGDRLEPLRPGKDGERPLFLPLVLGRQGTQLCVPLWLAGKLGVRGLVNAIAPGQLVYVNDQLSNRRFLVDTGAAYSILPHQSSGQPTGPPLADPDGRPLACWGDEPVHLELDGCRFK